MSGTTVWSDLPDNVVQAILINSSVHLQQSYCYAHVQAIHT
jgi:hypothetical protein